MNRSTPFTVGTVHQGTVQWYPLERRQIGCKRRTELSFETRRITRFPPISTSFFERGLPFRLGQWEIRLAHDVENVFDYVLSGFRRAVSHSGTMFSKWR